MNLLQIHQISTLKQSENAIKLLPVSNSNFTVTMSSSIVWFNYEQKYMHGMW